MGCESGPRRRPCNVEWVRDVVRQCATLNIPCYVKQIDAEADGVLRDWTLIEQMRYFDAEMLWPPDLRVREYPKEFKDVS